MQSSGGGRVSARKRAKKRTRCKCGRCDQDRLHAKRDPWGKVDWRPLSELKLGVDERGTVFIITGVPYETVQS